MPIGAIDLLATAIPGFTPTGLSELGWWVENNNLLFNGDMDGWVYKTADRGGHWTEGVRSADNLEITSIVTSPIYSDTGSSDQCLLVGTFDWQESGSDLENEVWISQDGAYKKDLENIGAEINTDPGTAWNNSALDPFGGPVVAFDAGWGTDSNTTVYAAAGGWLDRWQLIGLGATQLTRIDYSDVGVYRSEVNLTDPSASTWAQQWDADDFNA
jgi:hypothetical protein